ncbi:SusD family protein [bacterium A37T11]|nr:SusD family protein [bacterium A37T11]
MNIQKLYHFFAVIIITVTFTACEKDWLSAKRNLNAVVPVKLEDMRAILNNTTQPVMADDYAGMVSCSGAEANVTDDIFDYGAESERKIYTWNKTIYEAAPRPISEWDDSYQQVFNANVVLEGLQNIGREAANAVEWDDVKGGALFFRAKAFYNLLYVFSSPYEEVTAASTPGIPLRLGSDPNVPTTRATQAAGYEQLLNDLRAAIPLLRVQPLLKVDASRPAAYALLARCYLSMRDYPQAGLYADSALQLYPTLMDYRTMDAGTDRTYPFPERNEETILYSRLAPLSIFDANSFSFVVPELYALYELGDLRRLLFYRSTGGFRGNYTGSSLQFSGLTTDELFLIKAECQARQGQQTHALETLDYLLEKRYDPVFFQLHTIGNTPDVLELILQERRKELAFRGRRWEDLRRLNFDPGRAVTLHRIIQGQSYELPPNNSRYTFPIPDYIIQMTGIAQNER